MLATVNKLNLIIAMILITYMCGSFAMYGLSKEDHITIMMDYASLQNIQ